MSHPTCKDCAYMLIDQGYDSGHCYGLPPAMFMNGQQSSSATPAPYVKSSRRACSLFKALDPGDSNVRGKSHETLSNAYKHAHQEMPPEIKQVAPKVVPVDKPRNSQPKRSMPVNDF